MSIDPKLQEWLDWAEFIQEEIGKLLNSRSVYRRYMEIVKANPKIQYPPYFHEWVRKNYADQTVVAIRCQLDNRKDVRSFRRLLGEIQRKPELITREWHRTLYATLGPVYADKMFDQWSGTGDHINPKVVEADIQKLDELGMVIKDWVDENIAHFGISRTAPAPTYNDVDKFLDEFDQVVVKYILLLTASQYPTSEATLQFDWEVIFTIPWVVKTSKI